MTSLFVFWLAKKKSLSWLAQGKTPGKPWPMRSKELWRTQDVDTQIERKESLVSTRMQARIFVCRRRKGYKKLLSFQRGVVLLYIRFCFLLLTHYFASLVRWNFLKIHCFFKQSSSQDAGHLDYHLCICPMFFNTSVSQTNYPWPARSETRSARVYRTKIFNMQRSPSSRRVSHGCWGCANYYTRVPEI